MDEEVIVASYQSNASGSKVHTISKARNSDYSEINDALYKWFVLAKYPCWGLTAYGESEDDCSYFRQA